MKTMKIILATLTALVLCFFANAQTDIADARTYSQGSLVTITGVVTSGTGLGIIRYVQDASAGIAVYPASGSVSISAVLGDSVTYVGHLGSFNGLFQIDSILSETIHGAGTMTTPTTITANLLDEPYESQLIRVNGVSFAAGGATIAGNNNYNFTQGGNAGQVRIGNSNNLVGTTLPASPVDVIGILSQYDVSAPYTSGYQILPRDLNDFVILSNIYLTSEVAQSNIANTSFDLDWTTNITGTHEARYGTSPTALTNTASAMGMSVNHNLSLTGLTAGEIYYVQVFSVNGIDTAFSSVRVFATESNSTGQIDVYFNHTVDNSVSTGTNAIYVNNAFEDTIIAYMQKATSTIDIASYNTLEPALVAAANAAFTSGVTVRWIANDGTSNAALGSLNPGINVVYGNASDLMHNKFMVVDANSVNNSWVLTGSTNWSQPQLNDAIQNMIFIQDQSLAKAYTIEFNEMYGSTTATPNLGNAKFGSAKTNNTPHDFVVGGKALECYFSPSDLTTSKIEEAVLSADSSVHFALLSFTRNELGAAMINRFNAGVTVEGIIESTSDQGTEYTPMLAAGIPVFGHPASEIFHHKYAIVDPNAPTSDPMVITGSHNWSSAAELRNDENTVIIHDATIANIYYQEFVERYGNQAVAYAPVASNDTLDVQLNGFGVKLVIGNDFDQNGDPLMVTNLLQLPDSGTATNNMNGTITYQANMGFTGWDTIRYEVCDGGGLCDQASLFVRVYDPVSISNDELQNLLSVYPNPASNKVTFEMPADNLKTVEVYNATGQLIDTYNWEKGNSQLSIDLNAYSNGMYFYKAFSANGAYASGKISVLK